MSAPVQAGTELEVGFQGLSFPAKMVIIGDQPITYKKGYGQRDVTLDENGNTLNKARADNFESLRVRLAIEDDGTTVFEEGDVISLTPPGAEAAVHFEWQEDVETELQWNKTIVTGTLLKEASMDYSGT